MVDPQPLRLAVDTATDWPTVAATSLVGVGSIVTSILVAWITRVNQRSQLRASTATFRQQWMTELRIAVAEFFELVAMTKFEMEEDSGDTKTKISSANYSRIIFLQSKIGLMLDEQQPYTEKVNTLLDDIIRHLKGREYQELEKSVNSLLNEMNKVLEKAWGDIKNDLKGVEVNASKQNHI